MNAKYQCCKTLSISQPMFYQLTAASLCVNSTHTHCVVTFYAFYILATWKPPYVPGIQGFLSKIEHLPDFLLLH